MAYIYKITNQINNKVYIGQTSLNPKIRWNQHITDSKKEKNDHRALYSAFNKYGVENFSFEVIEETEKPNEREQYWINFYNSCSDKGYNLTLGGEGSLKINYEEIRRIWKENGECEMQKLRELTGHDIGHLKQILISLGEKPKSCYEIQKSKYGKKVLQFDKNNNFIAEYASVKEAERAMGRFTSTHITDVCNGKRKTAYQYIWKWKDQ